MFKTRKWKSYFRVASFPLYLVFYFLVVDLCFYLINFTNFAWLGFLIMGSLAILLIFLALSTMVDCFNYFFLWKYLKDNSVKLPWHRVWGIPHRSIKEAVENQQILLSESYLPVSKSEDIIYIVNNYTRKKQK